MKRLPAATIQRLASGSSGGGIGIFITAIIVLFVGAVAAVVLSGLCAPAGSPQRCLGTTGWT